MVVVFPFTRARQSRAANRYADGHKYVDAVANAVPDSDGDANLAIMMDDRGDMVTGAETGPIMFVRRTNGFTRTHPLKMFGGAGVQTRSFGERTGNG